MSYQAVTLPVITTGERHFIDAVEGVYYIFESVVTGGNFKLVKCTISPWNCQVLDTGVPVPSTDVHYNPWIVADDAYIYGLVSYWSDLRVYRFSKATGAGAFLGSVAVAGHNDLSYLQMIKVREDEYYGVARTGGGRTNTLFRFTGQPSEILSSTKWEKLGNIVNDENVGPSGCATPDINFTYPYLYIYKHRVALHSFTRCPDPYSLTRNVLVFYDPVKEKLINVLGQEVEFNLSTASADITVEMTTPPPANAIRRDTPHAHFLVTPSGKIYMAWDYRDSAGNSISGGLAVGQVGSRTLTYVEYAGGYLSPYAETNDNKLVSFNPRNSKYVLFDPSTNTFQDIVATGETEESIRYQLYCRTREFYIPCTYVWYHAKKTVILPPGFPDSPGLELIDTVDLTSPSAGTLRVQASFVRSVSSARVEVYNTATGALVVGEDITGPLTTVDKTYSSIPAGKYRAVVRGRKA